MTKEDNELWLRDLCARVPYHPKGHVVNACNGAECDEWLTCATFPMFVNIKNNCRLYLRPMSSMTEEEVEEYFSICTGSIRGDMIAKIDFYIKHHFDFRLTSEGLSMIEAGLALEALERMYDLDNK